MPHDRNLFSRLTKYRGLYGADPGEDRLTEAFAGLLDSAGSALAVHLVCAWLDTDGASVQEGYGEVAGQGEHLATEHLGRSTSLEVRTQVPLRRRFVDLELEFFSDDTSPPVTNKVRVELKRGTRPHGGQVKDYEERIDDKPTVPVVILAPADQLPFKALKEAPKTAPQRSWQQTYTLIKSFEFPAAEPERDRKEWLRDQFCEYLEEEGLMPLKRLNPDHLKALSVLDEAENGLTEVLKCARKEVEQNLGAPTREGNGEGVRSWRHYDIGVDLPSGAWAEFKVSKERFSSESLDPEPGIKFIAGLGWKGNALPEGFPGGTAAALEGSEFHHFREGTCGRLMRVLLPEDDRFLQAETIEAQGEALAGWVIQSFGQVKSAVNETR